MEVAKVTSKGQITVPISIRRKLGINEGEKVLFIDKADGVLMVNPNTFQGEYTADTVDTSAVAETAAPKINKDATAAPLPVAAVSPDKEETAVAEAPAASEPEMAVDKRPVPPPVEEPEKPDTVVGDFNLSTLLDDIRSIGSNI